MQMTHVRLTWIFMLAGALSCSRCDEATSVVDAGPVDAGPQVLTEAEPNETAEKALVIDRTTVVEATLGHEARESALSGGEDAIDAFGVEDQVLRRP